MELPEVENTLRTLPEDLVGRRITRVDVCYPKRIWSMSARTLRRGILNARFAGFGRRGKYLLLHLDNGNTLIWHLGMSGRVSVERGVAPRKHLLMSLELDDGRFAALYDARRFGRIGLGETRNLESHHFFHRMAPEPDDSALTPELLARNAKRFRKRSVKEALLDQSFVAGLGNIYACEVLFAARIDPRRPVRMLFGDELMRLLSAIRRILSRAIADGGTSIRDYVDSRGRRGRHQSRLKVYGREGKTCRRCGGDFAIARIAQGGRSTFFCPRCQG